MLYKIQLNSKDSKDSKDLIKIRSLLGLRFIPHKKRIQLLLVTRGYELILLAHFCKLLFIDTLCAPKCRYIIKPLFRDKLGLLFRGCALNRLGGRLLVL